jgi:hypothetical protein
MIHDDEAPTLWTALELALLLPRLAALRRLHVTGARLDGPFAEHKELLRVLSCCMPALIKLQASRRVICAEALCSEVEAAALRERGCQTDLACTARCGVHSCKQHGARGDAHYDMAAQGQLCTIHE